MIKKLLTLRIWILIIFLFMSLLAINPNPTASGIQIKTLDKTSLIAGQGISIGEIIKDINGQEISTLKDYQEAIAHLTSSPKEITIETDQKTLSYITQENLGFIVNENLTIISTEIQDLNPGLTIKKINNKEITSIEEIKETEDEIFPKQKLIITTNKKQYAFLTNHQPEITVAEAEKTNIKKGLDLQGGTRVLIKPVADDVSQKEIQDMIAVLEKRLNVYGLADVKIRSATDLERSKFILIEIAGLSQQDLRNFIAKQGKFEAKIGNEVVFEGGNKNIPFVCRGDGSCSGVRNCNEISQNQHACTFEFAIKLSEEAAKKHAKVTETLDINTTEGRSYLSKPLDLYLDGKLVDSLQISADLKGAPVKDIAISGPGYGSTTLLAQENALANMNNLQTVLITGSLPYDIEIVKLDTISPTLGKEFIKNAFLVGLIALIAVVIVIYIRYRTFKIIIPMVITTVSEVIIILGFASLMRWNLDLVAIAGIIAAVGTGVDDQIIIADEILKGEARFYNWKERIKRAFFIIIAAYFTTLAAMTPLIWASAGLVKGLALVTIIGVTIGVLITRPAFASIAEKLLN